MVKRSIALISSVTLGSLLLSSSSALAASNSSDVAQMQRTVQSLESKSRDLQSELNTLKARLRRMQAKKGTPMPRRASTTSRAPIEAPTNATYKAKASRVNSPLLTSQFYTMGSTITTSPYLGIRSAFDASDLVVNLPSMDEDLRLLMHRATLERMLGDEGYNFPQRPMIELSGKLIGAYTYTSRYTAASASTSDVDLNGAGLDALVEFGPWATGLISLSYDNAPPATGARTTNSNFHLDRAFFTLGRLRSSPVYFTLGQIYVPFGKYSSGMVTTALTSSLAKIKTRAILLGYARGGFYASIYGFKGDSFVTNNGIINNGGINFGYDWTTHGDRTNTGNVGVGAVVNMADSSGMQNNGVPSGWSAFRGFSMVAGANRLSHKVPGIDVHGNWTYGQVGFLAEYIQALKHFSAANLSMNGRGVKPFAFNVEASYKLDIEKPIRFALGYQQTGDALPLNLPWRSWFTSLNTSLWKNTIESLEFRHDMNYRTADVSAGNGATTSTALLSGGSRNIITVQIGAYF